jgi:hypothetical protein
LAGDAAPRVDPCASETKSNLASECIQLNPRAEHLVGSHCKLHPAFALQLDTVAFVGGYVASPMSDERPGRYIHSCVAVDGGGCVRGQPYTEVAYCAECRRVRAELEHGGR